MSRNAMIAATMLEMLSPLALSEADAKAANDKAAAEGITERGRLAGKLAQASMEGNWTDEEIDNAAKIAAKSGDQNDKSKAVLVSQIKNAAKVRVREHFADITTGVTDAWDEQEAIADAKNPNPRRALASRRYGLLCYVLPRIAAGEMQPDFTAEDLLTLAEAEAVKKKQDASKAAKKIASIIKQIKELDVDFPSPRLLNAAEELRELTEQKLIEARDKPKGVAAPPGQPAAGKGRAKPVFVQTSGEASGVEA